MVRPDSDSAFQEKTINDLNDVVCKQQQEIEKLGSICEALMKRIKEFPEFSPGIDVPASERPPHY